MRLSNLYAVLLEYGGLDLGRVTLDQALDEAGKDPRSIIAIQCPVSGYWAKDLNKSAFHSSLLQRADNQGVQDWWGAVRAYWVPKTGKLMLYQVETPGGHVIDPSEELIGRLADNLGISRKIMSIDIIG